ncbi:MAG: hypothetical protein JWN23_519 [Rhodocyclales bacterium]|nr:hypothetical protein [Rhodocyclales bacterium]
MRVIIFGATGMVGRGVLRECLLNPQVEHVLCVGRSPSGQTHAKLQDTVIFNLTHLSSIESELSGFDACFFCLGVSSAGKREKDYRHITFDITLAAARTLARLNPLGMTFVYVSGAGTDSSEDDRRMWARIKGQTENALLRLPFKAAFMFRPGFIVPMHGITSRTRLYRTIYSLTRPFWPLLLSTFPHSVTTTAHIGRAMLWVAKNGAPKRILETRDINTL